MNNWNESGWHVGSQNQAYKWGFDESEWVAQVAASARWGSWCNSWMNKMNQGNQRIICCRILFRILHPLFGTQLKEKAQPRKVQVSQIQGSNVCKSSWSREGITEDCRNHQSKTDIPRYEFPSMKVRLLQWLERRIPAAIVPWYGKVGAQKDQYQEHIYVT